MSVTLLDHIKKIVSLTEQEEEVVSRYMTHKILRKKDLLLKEGQVCTANYFIVKGCMRMYTVGEDATEQMIQFGIDNWWLTDYMSMTSGRPSQFYIRAVEDTELAVLPVHVQEELFTKVPAMERYFRIVLQKANAAAQMRIHFIFNLSGKERYEHFMSVVPEFAQRIPQYMLASYLGFTAEFLSKIRAGKV